MLANKLQKELIAEKERPPEKGGSEYEKSKEDFDSIKDERIGEN